MRDAADRASHYRWKPQSSQQDLKRRFAAVQVYEELFVRDR